MPAKRHYTTYTKDEIKESTAIMANQKTLEAVVHLSKVKFDDTDDINSYIECKHCSARFGQIDQHLKKWHKQTINEYITQYPDARLVALNISNRVIGDKNPAYNHGGKFSAHSDNFIHYQDLDENEIQDKKLKVASKSKQTKQQNLHKENTKIEYYLAQGYTNDEALLLLKSRQSTFSKEKCIKKHGEILGTVVWSNRQQKWHKSYKSSNYSKISQEVFWGICEIDSKFLSAKFAENKNGIKKDITDNRNYEETIIGLKPDFLYGNKIIEFNGTYWHSKPSNLLREQKRNQVLLDAGYDIYIVWEYEYNLNKNKAIKECIKFLNQ